MSETGTDEAIPDGNPSSGEISGEIAAAGSLGESCKKRLFIRKDISDILAEVESRPDDQEKTSANGKAPVGEVGKPESRR